MEFICNDCPRACNVMRTPSSSSGVCRSPSLPVVSLAAPHFGEEPCISGSRGAGTVFFNGCNLKCVFCQNMDISRSMASGRQLDAAALRDVFLELQSEGVHNIDLVTPTHFTRVIRDALGLAQLSIPVVWNSSGYESVETLRTLEGLVQVYMPDLKYMSAESARRYSSAPDYPEVVTAALQEMYRQTGPFHLDTDGLLRSGLLIRHLILPENIYDSMSVIDYVAENFPQGSVLFSLMSQFTPMPGTEAWPELQKRIDPQTAEHLQRYMLRCGITTGYCQDIQSATEEMIPSFDLRGIPEKNQ